MEEFENFRNDSYASPSQIHSSATSAVLITMAVIIFLENSAVCLLFASNQKLRTTTNTFVVSLAVSDLFVGVLFVPVYLCTPVAHQVNLYAVTFLLFSSLLNLCGVTYDRCHAIFEPLTYNAVFTCRRITTVLLCIWFVPVILILLPLTWSTRDPKLANIIGRVYVVLLVLIVFFTCAVISKIYFSIFKAIRRQLKMTRHVKQMFSPSMSPSLESIELKSTNLTTPSSRNPRGGSTALLGAESPQIQSLTKAMLVPNEANSRLSLSKQLKKRRFKENTEKILNDVRAVKLFAFIILIFVICWLPVVIINFLVAIDRVALVPKFIFDVSIYAFVANALINPVLYTFYKSDYRRAFLVAAGCKQKRTQFNLSVHLVEQSSQYQQADVTNAIRVGR